MKLVTIFSTTTCSSCEALTDWLDKQGQAYIKKITDEDPAAMMEFMSVNGGHIGVPFSVVTDELGIQTTVEGLDYKKFKQLLAA
jgi:glutaredoxin